MRSIVLAFAMFSRIPMPGVAWSGANMRYILAAFPLVGAVIGLAVAGWLHLCGMAEIGPFLRGTGVALIPFILSGGIHMDGFADTVDALASHADRDKKLRILKDPHVGSFAVFVSCGYFLGLAAAASELAGPVLACFPLYIASRALGAMALVLYPSGQDGLGKSFCDAASPGTSVVLACIALAAAGVLLIAFGGAAGLAGLCGCFLAAAYGMGKIRREFGGFSGDPTGWLVQMCEAAGVVFLVIGQKVL